jgi:hypothetical protein
MFARWRRDGKELFFVADNNMLCAITIRASASDLAAGDVQRLFPMPAGSQLYTFYDVSLDGQRFIVTEPASRGEPLTMLTSWQEA